MSHLVVLLMAVIVTYGDLDVLCESLLFDSLQFSPNCQQKLSSLYGLFLHVTRCSCTVLIVPPLRSVQVPSHCRLFEHFTCSQVSSLKYMYIYQLTYLGWALSGIIGVATGAAGWQSPYQ